MEKILNYIFDLGVTFGTKLITALIILLVGIKIIKFIQKWLRTSNKMDKLDSGVRSFMASFSGISLYIVLTISIAMILGIPTTSFITALASCGVAIGLALQGSLSNFAGGIMILVFKPFKVSDFIEVGNVSGTVSEITMVYTIVKTADNKTITIPNGTLTNSVIQNYSTSDTRRVDIDFTVSYDSDIDKVRALLMDIIISHPLTEKTPEPFARVTAHGDSAVVFTVRVWCKSQDYWTVKLDLLETVKKEFDKNGISIPFPQMDVHIDGTNVK